MSGKESQLFTFLDELEDYAPLIPDELTKWVLLQSGVKCDDERTIRLFSLAAEKFISDIVDEAVIVQNNRMQAPLRHQQAEGFLKDRKPALLTEDLAVALEQFGLRLKRPAYLERKS